MIHMKRPLSWIGFSASAAFLIASFCGVTAAVGLLIAGLVIALTIGVVPRLRVLHGLLTVCLTVSGAMGIFLHTELNVYQPLEEFAGQTLAVTLQMTDEPQVYTRTRRYTATVVEGDLPSGTKVALWVSDADVMPQPFDYVKGNVAFYPLEEDRLTLLQDKADGVVLSGSLNTWKGVTIETPDRRPWSAGLLAVRQAAGKVVSRYLSGDPAAMVKGLCLGDRDTLPDSITDNFRTCGVSHLLVVSGLHLGMVAAAVRWLLLRLRVNRKSVAFVTMLAVLAFMLLVGFTPSVKRAGVMTLVLLAGELCKREADGLNSLGLALLVIGMADPYMVWDVGLQLSAGATAGILALYPPMAKALHRKVEKNAHAWVRLFYRPAKMAAVSLSAMVILPLTAYYFGEVSLIFLPANLLMVFPATGAVVTGLLGVLVGGWCSSVGTVLFGIAGGLSRLLQMIAAWLSKFPWATVSVRQPYVWVWALLTAAVLFLFWKKITPPARAVMSMGAVAALMVGSITYHMAMRPITTCTFLEVEEGTAALMEWETGNMLMVTGDGGKLMRQVVAALSQRGVERLSVVVLPDLDDEALEGLPLLSHACRVDAVICPETGVYAPAVRSLFPEKACRMANESVFTMGTDHTVWFQNGWLRVMAGETRFLFGPDNGDAATLPASWKQTHMAALPDSVAHGEQIITAIEIGENAWTLATQGKQDIIAY